MRPPTEQYRLGLDYLRAATTLLQRVRRVHPTAGLYEAADLQWWWRAPRPTDELPQLFWFDGAGRPEAAVILTRWHDRTALDPLVLPDISPDDIGHLVERGLEHAAGCGFGTVGIEVDGTDGQLREVLAGRRFSVQGPGRPRRHSNQDLLRARQRTGP